MTVLGTRFTIRPLHWKLYHEFLDVFSDTVSTYLSRRFMIEIGQYRETSLVIRFRFGALFNDVLYVAVNLILSISHTCQAGQNLHQLVRY